MTVKDVWSSRLRDVTARGVKDYIGLRKVALMVLARSRSLEMTFEPSSCKSVTKYLESQAGTIPEIRLTADQQ